MNNKIGTYASIVNLGSVLGFALAMLFGSLYISYLTSIFIAFSFVVMISAFAQVSHEETKAAAFAAMIFAGMYALCNTIVYFVQISTVYGGTLDAAAASFLDFQQFGLIFNLDMLGYCLMALSTFFIGLTVVPAVKADRWLKWLLLIHGVFAISCFILPLTGMFSRDMSGGDWIGTAVLEFWCVYFAPVSVLSAFYFSRQRSL